ncbi:MAG: RraA family protein [Chloroflexota bacterium]
MDTVPARPYQLEMELVDDLREGEVIVAQCPKEPLCALWGGLLSNAAVGHRGAGVVTDGGARDYAEIMALRFPVFCRGLSPYDSMGRMEATARDAPITCGGVAVSPGDLIFADVDGVVVAPRLVAHEAIALAWEKVQGENRVREELRAALEAQWQANVAATGGGHAAAHPPEWACNGPWPAPGGFPHPPFQWDEERRFRLRCELDALYFHLYGVDRDDVEYILEQFPIVKRKDEARWGEYRTKRVVMEEYDAMVGSLGVER